MPTRTRLAVLISGGGTTLRNLNEVIEAGELDADVRLVISSKPDAPGLAFAEDAGCPSRVLSPKGFPSPAEYGEALFAAVREAGADFVIMAGFLALADIPPDFEHRVLNIHPSLIPAFCGKGYYGLRVHRAVLERGCKITGCTVHFVDNEYDHGPIIAQAPVSVRDDDTPESLAARVFETECRLYPQVIAAVAAGDVTLDDRRTTGFYQF